MKHLMMRVDGQRIHVLPHALQRYSERGCRHDDLHLAADELALLLDRHGRIQTDRPDWVYESDSARRTTTWLLLGDDIAFPLERERPGLLAAMTCVCRAGVGMHRHANRSKKRRGEQPLAQPAVENAEQLVA